MTVRINKQKINLREKLTEFEDKVNFDEVVRGLGDNTSSLILNKDGGNVGIGTTNPSELLEVHSESSTAAIEISAGKESETTGEAKLVLRSLHAASGTVYSRSEIASLGVAGGDSDLIFRTTTQTSGPEEHMRIDSEGNVGIGTTNPSFKLDLVQKDGGVQLQMGRSDTAAGTAWMGADSNGFHLGVGAYGPENSVADPNGFTVTASGNVGIGHTSPSGKLHVSDLSKALTGTVSVTVDTAAVTGSGTSFTTELSDGDRIKIGSKILIVQSITDNTNLTLTSDHTDGANGATAYTDSNRLIVTSAGNVGIGTTNPGYKLEVVGDINATVNLRAAGNIITSDDRTKHNEQAIVGAIETLGKLTPKKYIKTTEMYEADHDFELDVDGNPVDANGEPVEHSVEAGVIAQQVLAVPELAFMVSPEGVDEDGNVTSPHGLNYNSLFTYAIAAIQEQQAIIEDLKSRIETLESK